jgi:hypothetical protein
MSLLRLVEDVAKIFFFEKRSKKKLLTICQPRCGGRSVCCPCRAAFRTLSSTPAANKVVYGSNSVGFRIAVKVVALKSSTTRGLNLKTRLRAPAGQYAEWPRSRTLQRHFRAVFTTLRKGNKNLVHAPAASRHVRETAGSYDVPCDCSSFVVVAAKFDMIGQTGATAVERTDLINRHRYTP